MVRRSANGGRIGSTLSPMKRLIHRVLLIIASLLIVTTAAAVWIWNDPARAFALAMGADLM